MHYRRHPDTPLTWGLWRTAPDYTALRKEIAHFLETGGPYQWSDVHPAEKNFAQAMARAARAGFLPLEAERWTGQRAMVEGVVTDHGVLSQLLTAADAQKLTPVVHHRDRPGDVDGIEGAPITWARHRTLARRARNPRKLGAERFAPDLTDLWQVTLVAPEVQLLKVLDAFSDPPAH